MSEGEPLFQLLRGLEARGYSFTAVTPVTHAHILSRPLGGRPTLRDIFGWNRPFAPAAIDPQLLALLRAADALETHDGKLRSKLRVASLGGSLFLHSSFPTEHQDSVFFGPDTYRFVRFVSQRMSGLPEPSSVVDMGAGSGAGGITVARKWPSTKVTLVDVNKAALRLAAINAAHAGVSVETLEATSIPAEPDLVVANPPYMIDPAKRAYRDGGDLLGGAVALDWAVQALERMAPGGTMLLYVGVAFQRGDAPLLQALQHACEEARGNLLVEELDPDVFGGELNSPPYDGVERIAAMGAVITKPAEPERASH